MRAPVCCLFVAALFVGLIGTSGRVKYLLIIFPSTGELCEGGCHSDVDGYSSLGPTCSSAIISMKGPAGE